MNAQPLSLRFACLAVLLAAAFTPSFPTATAAAMEAETAWSSGVEPQVAAMRDGFAGIVVGLRVGDWQRVQGWGETSPGSGAVPDSRTIFEIGGVSKALTAATMARLFLAEQFKLSERIAPLFPEVQKFPDTEANPITFLNLASHTAGISRVPWTMNAKDKENPFSELTEEKLWAYLDRPDNLFPPGKLYIYSNTGYGLIGIAMQRKTGYTYESLVGHFICAPLGMTDTVITVDETRRARLAPGHTRRTFLNHATGGFQPAQAWTNPVMPAANAYHSTAADLLAFAWANANAPRDVTAPGAGVDDSKSPEFDGIGWALEITHEWQKRLDEDTSVALAWHVEERHNGYFVNGGTGGYASFVGFVKPTESTPAAAFVILTNTVGNQPVDKLGLWLIQNLGPDLPVVDWMAE